MAKRRNSDPETVKCQKQISEVVKNEETLAAANKTGARYFIYF